MKYFWILLISSLSLIDFATKETNSDKELILKQAVGELEIALDAYFALFDGQDLDLFVQGVRHAGRGRLLLEQYLGEEIDSYKPGEDNTLKLIALRAEAFSSDAAKEFWRQDPDDWEEAKLRLSELEHMVRGLKQPEDE